MRRLKAILARRVVSRSPLPGRGSERGPLRPRSARRRAERGVAMLVVMSTLALVASVVADFQFNARVDLQLAVNARDEVQAEYNALSALRLRALLLKNSRVLTDSLATLGGLIGMTPEAMPPIGQLLEMIPVECSLLSSITKAAGESPLDEPAAEGDGFFAGDCRATGTSEHAKISLASMRINSNGEGQAAAKLMLGFLGAPKLERFFQHDDAAGQHAETPLELVGAIIDWMDTDKTQSGNQVSDEERFYENLRDPYRVKDAPFDSVAEVQLVHGLCDELYDLLKERVTIYNASPQVELATADNVTIAIALAGLARTPADAMLMLTSGLFWGALLEMRSLGGAMFMPLTVANLKLMIEKVGLPLDTGRLQEVFSDRSSTTWYTIDAEGELGNARKRIRAVYQTFEGQYYYYRIE